MAVLLCHKDVYIPEHAKIPLHEGPLKYGQHATNVAREGGDYGVITLPKEFFAKNATLIEAELNDKTGAVEKQVWRQKFNDEWDMCFPMLTGGFIKTVWLNRCKDTHATLNKNKFLTGYQWRSLKSKLSPKIAQPS